MPSIRLDPQPPSGVVRIRHIGEHERKFARWWPAFITLIILTPGSTVLLTLFFVRRSGTMSISAPMMAAVIGPCFLGFIAATTAVSALRRRAKRRDLERLRSDNFMLCTQCGYSLVNSPLDGTCPECGFVYTAEGLEESWLREHRDILKPIRHSDT